MVRWINLVTARCAVQGTLQVKIKRVNHLHGQTSNPAADVSWQINVYNHRNGHSNLREPRTKNVNSHLLVD